MYADSTTSLTRIAMPTSESGRGQKNIIDIISNVRKMEWSSTGHINRLKDDRWNPRVSPLGDHMTRKGDKGGQPKGGETTLTNTGTTRYGRGQHKAG